MLFVLSSCVDTGFILYNEEGKNYDVYEGITLSKDMFEDTVFYHKDKKTYVPISGRVGVDFGIDIYEENIQKYNGSDSLHQRLKYHFSIPTPVLPTVKLNSFSFINKNGDTIPHFLYYRTEGRVVNIIDSLPVIFTDGIKKEKKRICNFCRM